MANTRNLPEADLPAYLRKVMAGRTVTDFAALLNIDRTRLSDILGGHTQPGPVVIAQLMAKGLIAGHARVYTVPRKTPKL